MKTDSQIQQDVQAELKWHPLLKAHEIGVAVKEGVVTLSGNVNTYAKKRAAEKAAKRVDGVRAVAEDIVVRLFPNAETNDSDLAAAVTNALKWHSVVTDEKIKIKVEDGWVTLEGTADWGFQKEAAENAIENLKGVKGVINRIEIAAMVEAQDVKKQIAQAFHRSATIDAAKITIDIIDDRVILKGHVRSLAEKRDAEKASWFAPGVRKVENRLEVERPALVM